MPKKQHLSDVKKSFFEIHGNRYNYDLITEDNYKNMTTKVPIVCEEHGIFYTTPNKHIKRHQGCPKCKGLRISEIKKAKPRFEIRTTKFGFGVCDLENCVFEGKKDIQSYRIWNNMLVRCYDDKYHLKYPTYIGCSVCDEWLLFSKFKEWFDKNYIEGYALDKDILCKGNKVYSPTTCCFVPNEINALLIKHDNKRGKYPIGVGKHGDKFCARINLYGKTKWIGVFNTKEDAFSAYKQEKENYLKEIAEKYFNDGKITKKVYNALCKYEVNIND